MVNGKRRFVLTNRRALGMRLRLRLKCYYFGKAFGALRLNTFRPVKLIRSFECVKFYELPYVTETFLLSDAIRPSTFPKFALDYCVGTF